MNIIELAKEAGFGYIGFPPEEGEWVCKESGLERFAALVRAEREWVDLTDDEIDELKRDYCIKADDSCWWEAVGAVIAAFKAKQGENK